MTQDGPPGAQSPAAGTGGPQDKGLVSCSQERLLESGVLDFAIILFGTFTYMLISSTSLQLSFTTLTLIFVRKSCMNLELFIHWGGLTLLI